MKITNKLLIGVMVFCLILLFGCEIFNSYEAIDAADLFTANSEIFQEVVDSLSETKCIEAGSGIAVSSQSDFIKNMKYLLVKEELYFWGTEGIKSNEVDDILKTIIPLIKNYNIKAVKVSSSQTTFVIQQEYGREIMICYCKAGNNPITAYPNIEETIDLDSGWYAVSSHD